MSERAYLDWNATAPMRPQVAAAIAEALNLTGNASSVHAEGRRGRSLVEQARSAVAALVGAEARNVTFTSGGTEANVLALGGWGGPQGAGGACDRLLVSAIEHPSVLAGGRFQPGTVEQVPATREGTIDLEALQALLQSATAGGTRPLVSVMLANNETGIVQPVSAVAERVHAAGGLLHVDAVQAAGRIPIDIGACGADLLTLSAHKIGGPMGAGALVRRDAKLHLGDVVHRGGGQERGLRAGTENVPAIVGFGVAAEFALRGLHAEAARLARLRERLEHGLAAITPAAVVFGAEARRLPNTTLFACRGLKAETAVIAFDLEGIAVSSGAACSSGKVQPSHVLAAMGVEPDLARGAVRVSLGHATTEIEVDGFLCAWRKLARALLKETPGMAA